MTVMMGIGNWELAKQGIGRSEAEGLGEREAEGLGEREAEGLGMSNRECLLSLTTTNK
ncbi:hypothetical protein [Tychonema sp. LEGE 06208]|uniref:hypothetical protein n=1 Tax=Tychonema sp. LEGE 06208 TaxID=1828663 RepID=UPI00187E25D5|nr:hypothetical protein [Tychonema sp. LEGE 06208]MBE9163720.1 hypothetical protein [Tychonema sp. LEGE 06208]